MKIGSKIVGTKFKKVKTKVTWRQTSNYAASIGDTNEFYINDLAVDKNVAHPMFAVVLSWPIISNLYEQAELPYPKEIFDNLVHYFEHIEVVRLISPKEVVIIEGEIIAVLPQRSGSLLVSKFAVTDEAGNLIHTEYIGGILRGIKCQDEGKGMENISFLQSSESEAYDWESLIHIQPELPYIYDGCNDIVFDIHTSPKFAKSVGLPNIIVQGTAILGIAISEIVKKEANNDPKKIKSISARFTDIVIPGSTIQVQATNVKNTETQTTIFFQVLNSSGKVAIRDGVIKIKKG